MNNFFSPLSEEEFFVKFWGQEPYISLDSTENAEFFSHLIDVTEIDEILTTQESPDNCFELVKPGAFVKKQRSFKQSTMLNLDYVYQAYGQGYTLLMTKVHQKHRKIRMLCRSLEEACLRNQVPLSSQVKANTYLTPKNSMGFPVHYDNHDVIVVQISGKKEWSIFNSLEQHPIEKCTVSPDIEETLQLQSKFTLNPGNWIYIPRGHYHKAHTSNNIHSLHVTISLNSYTWIDLIRRLAEREVEFKKPIELIPSNRRLEGITKLIKSLIDIKSHDINEVLKALRCKTIREMDKFPDHTFDSINKIDTIDQNTKIALRKGISLFTEENSTGNNLQCTGFSSYGFGNNAMPILHFLLNNPKFRISDLPTPLNDQSKINLAQQLVNDGVYVIC